MRWAVLVLLLLSSGLVPACRRDGHAHDGVLLELSLADRRRVFQIGETIPVKLAFSSREKKRYQLNEAHYDRSGRMNYEEFTVTPADGAVDPVPELTESMGGLTNYRLLERRPWTIELKLNEWVRFTKPGDYRLVVTSKRVEAPDSSGPFGTAPVVTRSNTMTLRIRAANADWQRRVCKKAATVLDVPAPKNSELEEEWKAARADAVDTLRFLGTADAAREMASRLRGEDDNADFYYYLGLVSTAERAAAREALEQALIDPEHPITERLLEAYEVVALGGAAFRSPVGSPQKRDALEKLIAALPVKRGNAAVISLSTATTHAWDHGAPAEMASALAEKLVGMFDELPVDQQNVLLNERWDKVATPGLLPLLQRYAAGQREAAGAGMRERGDAQRLAETALKRWYELDPVGARPAIIAEIITPRRRFDADVLKMLPDETLPEADLALAGQFESESDSDISTVAALIARYSTAAILHRVAAKFDPQLGEWGCSIQQSILGYMLRVDAELARPRLERALAARSGSTACYAHVFSGVSAVHYHPLLEEFALRSIDDPDLGVAADAASMLGRFASAAAEPVLWRRFEQWSKQWAGRESELDTAFIGTRVELQHEALLGRALSEALATGRGWLVDGRALQRLCALSKVYTVRQPCEQRVTSWKNDLPRVSVNVSRGGLFGHVAHYEFEGVEALKERLSQFPSATRFLLSVPVGASRETDEAIEAVRTVLRERGFAFEEEQYEY